MDRMISEIERARVKYSPKDVDNKEFYKELYSILKEICSVKGVRRNEIRWKKLITPAGGTL